MNYGPLETFLRGAASDHVPLTFAEVEQILGGPLPRSARKHRPWWANSPEGHSHAKAWLGVGYKTRAVDMAGEKLVFEREVASGISEEGAAFKPGGLLERLRAKIGGTVTVMPGVDLTEPTGEIWDAERD